MGYRNCCTCDCCEERETADAMNETLQEFLDANINPDAQRLAEFLVFFTKYNDPLVRDKSWYTHERLMDLFTRLQVII